MRGTDEGFAAVSGLVTLADTREVFAKTFARRPGDDVFAAEAEGLEALRDAGLTTPDVVHRDDDLLVPSLLQPRPDAEQFWERLAHDLARLHAATVTDRFGWPHDNWLGSLPQRNAWHDDGFEFFAECRSCAGCPSRASRRSWTAPSATRSSGCARRCRSSCRRVPRA